jgi:hypothetical protein
MKRKTSTVPTRIYTFGAMAPTANAQVVEAQMRAAHRYRNDLIAIERARVEAVRAIVSAYPSVAPIEARIAEMDAELAALRDGVRRVRAAARSRTPPDEATAARIAELKANLKAARAERKAAKLALREGGEVKAQLDLCHERANDMVRRVRAACGVYWGTYLLVEKSVEQSAERSRKEGGDPQFARWSGRGRIGVQIQGGIPTADLFGDDLRIRIDLTPRVRTTRRHPNGIEVPNSATLWLRVGSEGPGGRTPVWAAFPIKLHRPLPEDGVVKWAWVRRTRCGTRWAWEFQLSIEAPSFVQAPRAGAAVAVDFGAKGAASARIVAKAVGTDGRIDTLHLPESVRSALAHADSLRSIRDREFNTVREVLIDWLAGADVPDWMADAAQWAPRWRSPKRLVQLVYGWRDQRFAGDEAIYTRLDAWRRQDRHLYQWESEERNKALLRRREVYRVWAADLARRYARLVTEDVDFARVARNAAPEEDATFDGVHRTRVEAAPGEARACVRGAFSERGRVLIVDGRSKRCPACGGAAAEGNGFLACAPCGARMEADFGRCWNLLRDAEEDVSVISQEFKSAVSVLGTLKEAVQR